MIDPGEVVSETLKREFGEEAMNSLNASSTEREKLKKQVAALFKDGSEVCWTQVLFVVVVVVYLLNNRKQLSIESSHQ